MLEGKSSSLSYSKASRRLYATTGESTSVFLWDHKKLSFQCRLLWNGDKFPDIVLQDQCYASMGTVGREIPFYFVKGNRTYPAEQFDLRLNRPDVFLEHFGAPSDVVAIAKETREKRLKKMGVTEQMLQPGFHLPDIEFVGELPVSIKSDQLKLRIRASDSKYNLERLKVYINNVPVNGRDGEDLRNLGTQILERDVSLLLGNGRNKIQVSTVNSAGAESLFATTEITCSAKRSDPSLFAVALGVSQYRDKNWNLRYAAKDAKDVAAVLKSNAGGRYASVNLLVLTDGQVTKGSLTEIRKFLSPTTVDDSVVMFVAGHGLLDERYNYYFGTSDVDFNKPSNSGISFDELEEILSGVPSLRKSLLVDTCHAGELDDEGKRLLGVARSDAQRGGAAPLSGGTAMNSTGTRESASSEIAAQGNWFERLKKFFGDRGPTILNSGDTEKKRLSAVSNTGAVNVGGPVDGGQITMNSVGTRGMAVKSVEGAKGRGDWYERLQGLFVDLRRGGGSTILSSSAGVEYALESSEQKNGLFTYALLEALRGTKAADLNNDGTIQISEVSEYVKKRVVELTNGRQTPNVRRVNLEGDFPLATVEK
jgi:uncharacterized caspase-like protein